MAQRKKFFVIAYCRNGRDLYLLDKNGRPHQVATIAAANETVKDNSDLFRYGGSPYRAMDMATAMISAGYYGFDGRKYRCALYNADTGRFVPCREYA